MPFTYQRTIHFPDTDAAGVVFFPKYLSICHEAYEEALAHAGVDVKAFFSNQSVVVPVSKSNADYLRPLYCGDKIRVTVRPVLLTETTFSVDYEMVKLASPEKLAAQVRTHHVCIFATTRDRTALPVGLANWIRLD